MAKSPLARALQLLALAAALAAPYATRAAAVAQPAHAFDPAEAWAPHPDGGRTVEVAAAATPYGPGLRLRYTDAPPHWGNVAGPCRVPPSAAAMLLRVMVHGGSPRGVMHVWLLQPNGDAWMSRSLVGGVPAGRAAPGWHVVRLPLSGFEFQARGSGDRRMVRSQRMLIGCNFGSIDMTVADMRWELAAAAAPSPLPRLAPEPARGPRGALAVLELPGRLPDGVGAAAPPAQIAAALRTCGFGAALIGPGDLADPAYLTPARFDAVFLPYGPCFPAAARDAFVAYLKAGGSFFSLGGYAFDRLAAWDGAAWTDANAAVTAADLSTGRAPVGAMNTRTGTPGDAMTFLEDQIGVFDPASELGGARRLRVAEGYHELHPRAVWDTGAGLRGFSACGLIGCNNPVFPPVYRRYRPVLEALDEGGAAAGVALGVMHNFAGNFRGSSWAFSGVSSGQDLLFGTPARRELLRAVTDEIVTKAVLHGLRTDEPCYREGETVRFTVVASNFGRRAVTALVRIRAGAQTVCERTVTLEPGASATVTAAAAASQLRAVMMPVQAELRRDGVLIDTARTGFCVWSDATAQRGPRIGWARNYVTVDGRPTLLAGANQTGMMFASDAENPAVWERDLRGMADHNLHLLRILHFSPFADRSGNTPAILAARPERLCRQMDAIVQIAMSHRVAICLTLHDWMDVALTAGELELQANWARFWAHRYRNVPGVIFDVQNEPEVKVPDRPDIVALWNTWLRDRYGSDARLRDAWWRNPPGGEMPNVPLGARTDAWDDVHTADLKRFETVLLNRWLHANVDGVRAGNPNAVVLVGYLPSMPPADKALGVEHTDISNTHYYGPVSGFLPEFRFSDRRFAGKGMSVGEFGAEEAHNARIVGAPPPPPDVSITRFRAMVHDAFGAGCAFLANWCWKDFDEMEFPWGLVHRGDAASKPWAHTYAQDALFAAFARPVYAPPGVMVLLPDAHRIGPKFDAIHDAVRRCFTLLSDASVDFGVIDEQHVAQLPAGTRALFWPIPYCPDDAVLERVVAWVRAGGVLYTSGSLAFDHARRPVRQDRHRLLGLPDGPGVPPWETPEAAFEAGPTVVRVGRGSIVYAPYPLETRPRASDAGVYAAALHAAGAVPHAVEAPGARVRVSSIALEGGGRLIAVARTDDGAGTARIALPAIGTVIWLAGGSRAFVRTAASGAVTAAESDGPLQIGGVTVAEAVGHYAVVALDARDLRQSTRVLVLPYLAGEVRLPGMRGLRDARAIVDIPGGRFQPRGPGALPVRPAAIGQVAVVAPDAEMTGAVAQVRRAVALQDPVPAQAGGAAK